MRLVVVTSVVHYSHQGQLYAYGPYARELEVWADLFEAVTVAGPLRHARPAGDCLPVRRHNIGMAPQREAGGQRWIDKLAYLWLGPLIAVELSRELARAEAIHVRCPCNLGLLGVLLAPLFSKYLVAKYAGQWTSYPGEPPTVRLQRRLLASRWWHGPVTVYGACGRQPSHVVPFFTSLLTDEHMARAKAASGSRTIESASRILYVGRLSRSKNVGAILGGVARVRAAGLELTCTIAGEGPERANLEARSAELGLTGHVRFTGGLSFDQILEQLERADILALVSETEGWPKAIVEAMAFGLVCIGSDRGQIPRLLGGGRGIVVAPGDEKALADSLIRIVSDPESFRPMIHAASAWAQQFSLGGLRASIRELLETRWGRCLADSSIPEQTAREAAATR